MNLDPYHAVCKELSANNARLVAVSKTKPVADILQLYHAGQRVFGENKVQELSDKQEQLPKDIEWHLIGHLQSNKVKYIAPFISMIHSIDSIKLLEEVNRQAQKCHRTIDCLLQIHIAQEVSKFGFDEQEVLRLFETKAFNDFKNIRLCGLMAMATLTDDEARIAGEFEGLKKLFETIKTSYMAGQACFKELSMGMSSDYTIALQQGATMVRIGSTIFGSR